MIGHTSRYVHYDINVTVVVYYCIFIGALCDGAV